jgi:HNH endonuclease
MKESRYITAVLKKLVAQRAEFKCEYCKLSQEDSFFTFHTDHVISMKHGGLTLADNLAYSCAFCNSCKGSDVGTVLLPEKTFIRLFNPREDVWNEHFEVINFVFYAKTIVGEATIKVLQLNHIDRIIERQLLDED